MRLQIATIVALNVSSKLTAHIYENEANQNEHHNQNPNKKMKTTARQQS